MSLLQGSVERRELVFGGRIVDGGAAWGVGNPGAPSARHGSWLRLPPRPASSSAGPPPNAYLIDHAYVGQHLVLANKVHTEGPVRAIAIAPDSPIQSADVIFGSQRHRIAPGSPLLGDLREYDSLLVAPTRMVPGLFTDASGDDLLDAFWEATVTRSDGLVVGWPLRLCVYRGDAMPLVQTERAPYVGVCAFQCGAGTTQSFWICTDGRQRVDVMVTARDLDGGSLATTITGFDATVTADAVDGSGVPGLIEVELETAEAVTVGGPVVRSYEGNPFWGFRVEVTSTGGDADGAIHVHAWDR